MAGLIAGHMLRRHKPTIFEASPNLPDNHSALLRFRNDSVPRATSIPFKKVFVRKGVVAKFAPSPSNHATLADVNAYSEKVSGVVSERSIGNLESCERWVAPDDFLQELYNTNPAEVCFGHQVDELSIHSKSNDEVWISTIPMPIMMKLVGWDQGDSKFIHKPITTLVAHIGAPITTVYQTVYLPHAEWGNLYRASIHGNELILEYVGSQIETGTKMNGASHPEIARHILAELFGMTSPLVIGATCKTQKFGKMVEVDDLARKTFIRFLTDQYNIYSLGRFATWRPLLLDDIVSDIEVIEKLIKQSPYDRKKH